MNCSRTVCQMPGANCLHRFDNRWYCENCARLINWHNMMTPPLILIPDDKGVLSTVDEKK